LGEGQGRSRGHAENPAAAAVSENASLPRLRRSCSGGWKPTNMTLPPRRYRDWERARTPVRGVCCRT